MISMPLVMERVFKKHFVEKKKKAFCDSKKKINKREERIDSGAPPAPMGPEGSPFPPSAS